MKINEVEKLLEIPKATIRFYEKEGLVTPQRKENSYREYSDEDLEVLKKIIVLRKIGVAVEDIKQVLNNQLSLQEALSKNITSLYEQMEEIQGSIKVCSLMQEKEEDIETFDENYYWNVIHVEEENGQSFIDVAKDYLQFEKALLDNVTGGGNKRFAVIAISLLIAAIVRGVVSFMTGTGFLNGFLGAFVVLVTVSVIFLPAFLLRKRESAKEKYVKSIGRMAAIFLILVFFLVVIMLLNGKLHFLF